MIDFDTERIEAFYQGFFLGLIAHCEPHHFIRSEFPAGEGRADLLLIPKSHYSKKKALLLEYKVGKKSEGLAQKALDQVLERDYHAEVENHPYVVESTSIGLSFYGKDYALKSQHWQRKG